MQHGAATQVGKSLFLSLKINSSFIDPILKSLSSRASNLNFIFYFHCSYSLKVKTVLSIITFPSVKGSETIRKYHQPNNQKTVQQLPLSIDRGHIVLTTDTVIFPAVHKSLQGKAPAQEHIGQVSVLVPDTTAGRV